MPSSIGTFYKLFFYIIFFNSFFVKLERSLAMPTTTATSPEPVTKSWTRSQIDTMAEMIGKAVADLIRKMMWVFEGSDTVNSEDLTVNPIGNGNGLETATTGDHAYPSKTTDNMNPEVNEGNTPTSSTIKSYDHGAEKFVTSTQKSSKRETDMDFVDDIDDILSDDFDFSEYENKVNTTEEYNSNDGIIKVIDTTVNVKTHSSIIGQMATGQKNVEDVMTENNDPVERVNALEIDTANSTEHEIEMTFIPTESLSLVTEQLDDKINDNEESDHDMTENFELVTNGKVEMEVQNQIVESNGESKSMENEHYGGSNEAFMTEITTIGGHKTKIIAMADVSYGRSKKDINSSGGSTITNNSSTASNNLSTEELKEIVTRTETLGVLPTSSSKENLDISNGIYDFIPTIAEFSKDFEDTESTDEIIDDNNKDFLTESSNTYMDNLIIYDDLINNMDTTERTLVTTNWLHDSTIELMHKKTEKEVQVADDTKAEKEMQVSDDTKIKKEVIVSDDTKTEKEILVSDVMKTEKEIPISSKELVGPTETMSLTPMIYVTGNDPNARTPTPTVVLEDLSRDGIISEDDANNVEMINGSNHEENLEPALEALITNSEMKENSFDQMVKEIRLDPVRIGPTTINITKVTATSDAKEVIIDVTASFDANESNIPKKSKDSTEKSDMTGDVSSLDVNHVMKTTEPNVERSKMACKCGPF